MLMIAAKECAFKPFHERSLHAFDCVVISCMRFQGKNPMLLRVPGSFLAEMADGCDGWGILPS